MDTKETIQRNLSTEQLSSLNERTGKQLEEAQEQVNIASASEEELFLQNIFLDKQDNVDDGLVAGTTVEPGGESPSQESRIPPSPAEATDAGLQSAVEKSPDASTAHSAPFIDTSSVPQGDLGANRNHALNVRDTSGARSDEPNLAAAALNSTTPDSAEPLTGTEQPIKASFVDSQQLTGASVAATSGIIGSDTQESETASEQGEVAPPSSAAADKQSNLDTVASEEIVGDPDAQIPPVADISVEPVPDTISDNPVNHAPTVESVDLGSTDEDTARTFTSADLLANAGDIDGDSLQITGVSVEPGHGSIADNADGSWTFTPSADYHGEDVPLSFTVSDGSTTTEGNASLDISAINDAPTVGTVDLGSTDEDTARTFTSADLLANAGDIDGDSLQITGVSVEPGHGSIADNADGSWTFTPSADYHGEDVPLSFTVSDGSTTTEGNASLDISAINDAPTVGTVDLGSTDEDTARTFTSADLLANAGDIDGDSLQITGVSVEPGHGSIADNADGSWTFTPSADYHDEDVPLSFTVSDGSTTTEGNASLDISAINDAPTVGTVDLGSTDEDTARTFTSADLLANAGDIDGDSLQITGVSVEPDHGSIADNDDGSWTFTPSADYHGEDVPLSFTVSDGSTTTEGNASLDISAINDAPTVGTVDLGSTDEDTPKTFTSADLLANAGDIDGDQLQVTSVSVEPDHGSVTDNTDGSWTFTPTADYHGEDVPLSFTVSDGSTSSEGSASLDILMDAVEGEEFVGSNKSETITGTAGDDTITGRGGNDTLVGGDGDDTFKVRGNAGMDQVDGGDGNDTILGSSRGDTIQVSDNLANIQNVETIDGGKGYDVLQGGKDDDTLDFSQGPALANIEEIDGGRGDDTIIGTAGNDTIEGNVGNDTLSGGDGDDTFKVRGNAGMDQVDGGDGNDTILGSSRGDTIQVSDNLANIQNVETIDGGKGYDVLQGGSGDDTLDFSQGPALANIEEIDGGRGDDTIIGTAGNDTIEGNVGNDTLVGGDGDDTFKVRGNAGMDQVDGGDGNDTILGSSRGDTIQVSDNLANIQNVETIDGGKGYDVLQGGKGDDTLDFSQGPALANIEEIDGGRGDDTIIGTAGNDTIEGNVGNDTLSGGDGDDTFKVRGNAGMDQVDGGDGNDTILGSSRGDTIQVSDNLANIQNVETIDGGKGYDVLQGGKGDDTLDFSQGPALANIEEIDGGRGDDTIIGTAGNDTIEGNVGNDTLVGGDGDDTFKVRGNAGMDQVDGGDGNDTILGSSRGDTIQVSDNLANIQNVETIDGGKGYDVLQGGSGDDTLDFSQGPALANIEEIDGGRGDDTIIGTAGNDTIEGNAGNDTLVGGDGDDTFKVRGNAGMDQVDGGDGNDTILGSSRGDTIQVSDNLANIQNVETIDGGKGYDVLQGGSGDDTLDFSQGPALANIEEIDGGRGDDTIIGSDGSDHIDGNRGNDTLSGGGADDTLDGGQGTDTFVLQGFRSEYIITQNDDSTYTTTDTVENRDGTDTIDNFEFVAFQDETVTMGDILSPVEPDAMAAQDMSGEELLFAMDSDAGSLDGQGWAESVQAADAEADTTQESEWDLPQEASQGDADLAATALDLTPDTSGVVAMTEGTNTVMEGLEMIEG